MKQVFLLLSVLLPGVFSPVGYAQSISPSQQRDVKNFSAISLSIPAEVTITKGDYSFSMDASPELSEKIKTEVKNGELEIRFVNNWNDHGKESIKIEIRMPSLVAAEVNGSGEINSASAFDGQRLNLEINGSGKIKLGDIAYANLSAIINGSGHISDLKGSGDEVKMQINGSGEITGDAFSGKNVNCNVTGSGNISVSVSETLDAEITGSGDIHYGGAPSKKNVNIIGSGSVTAMK